MKVGFISFGGAARARGGRVGVNVEVLVSKKPGFVEEKRKITEVFREGEGGIVGWGGWSCGKSFSFSVSFWVKKKTWGGGSWRSG